MATPIDHHKFGPSTLKHLEICPSFRNSGETNPAAEEGTMLHHAVETENFEGLTDDQLYLVNKVLDEVRPLREGADEVVKEIKLHIDLG
jgi:hypothetical protein